ncbi:DUF2949 domain-containing protein [Leptolyngbya sp. AN03gr2]|uniref:DUF2949 domain-containing protein n=1 Tax=unclassified Leptolyngbya TaxID=2650499 RepID=UPI003D31ACA3
MAVLSSETNEQIHSDPPPSELGEREPTDSQLIRYLKEELAVPDELVELALRHSEQERGTLPMVLWRYGFVSIDQLNQIFDWMAR